MIITNIIRLTTHFFSSVKWLTEISFEFYSGFLKLHKINTPCVTVFGSARFNENNHHYQITFHLGQELGKAGFAVMTGGGPGLMEAANRGAKEAGGLSIGCNIQLPHEQESNPYVDHQVTFKHFFIRKYMLARYSCAFVAAPGGFGTLDELFEIITLVQTSKMKSNPIYLLNSNYWKPIFEFARIEMLQNGTINEFDLNLIKLSDDPKEIVSHLKQVILNQNCLAEKTVLLNLNPVSTMENSSLNDINNKLKKSA